MIGYLLAIYIFGRQYSLRTVGYASHRKKRQIHFEIELNKVLRLNIRFIFSLNYLPFSILVSSIGQRR